MKIDNQMLDAFRKDFAEAVKDLEKQYGVVLSLGRITYGYDNFRCQLEAKSGDSRDDVLKKEFEQNCSAVGLYPEDYGQTFTQQGKQWRIIGIDLKKRKYPIIIEEVATGRTCRCTAAYIKSA
jgi:hypothetical protein